MLTIAIGGISVSYHAMKTKAPKVYDGPTIDLYDGGEGEYRYILVREDQLTWQTRRNASGLYSLEETDEIPASVISETLWERVTKNAD